MRIDVDVYISQFKTFFKENPDELIKLIGDRPPQHFFDEVYKAAMDNVDQGHDPTLTQQQIIDIVRSIVGTSTTDKEFNPFFETKVGTFCLN